MATLLQDLKYGLRMLRKNTGFTAVAVLTLALGIGANTAPYSLLNAVFLRMLPVETPEQLVVVSTAFVPGNDTRYGQSFSYPLYRELRDHTGTLQGVIAYRTLATSLSVNGATERVTGELVSGNYFSVLGVKPFMGTMISAEDDEKPGSGGSRGPVTVLSYGFWRRRFGADPSVIGKSLDLNGQPFTVIGVAAPGFSGTEVGEAPDVFAPMMMQLTLLPWNANGLTGRRNVWLRVMGRLKPEVSAQQAEAELTLVLQRFNQEDISRMSDLTPARRGRLLGQRITLLEGSTGTSGLRRKFSQPLTIVMVVVLLVLLIACANVANLLLARAMGRQREIAVRLSLGATRRRLLQQLVAESLVLSFWGAAFGLVISRWVRDLLLRFLPKAQNLDVSVDKHVLGFTLLLAAVTGLVFGLVPALQATKPNLTPALKGELTAGQPRHFGLRKGIVVLQVALSLLLLIGAGLFVRTLQNLDLVDPGFIRERVLLLSVDPSLRGYKADQAKVFFDRLLERVRALPAVRSVSLADCAPLGNHTQSTVFVQGYQPRPDEPTLDPSKTTVAPGYFGTMGIPLLLGRDFSPQDSSSGAKVAIVNQTFARHYFPNQNAVGQRLGLTKDKFDVEIVGVVKDSKYGGLREAPTRMVYLPLAQGLNSMVLHVRTASNAAGVADALREQVRALDKDLPVFDIRTVEQQVDLSLAQEKLVATLSGLFGLLALGLSAVGLYGVMAYSVGLRTREIGIRMALGARQGEVLWMVLRETFFLALTGITIGIPTALAAARLASSQIAGLLFELKATDPVSIGIAASVMVVIAALAGYLPARRASRVDPMVALRYE